jgi:hypothetical protein
LEQELRAPKILDFAQPAITRRRRQPAFDFRTIDTGGQGRAQRSQRAEARETRSVGRHPGVPSRGGGGPAPQP